MSKILNSTHIINALGGDTTTGMCRCPVPSHGKGRGDERPSLWISPEGAGLKCHAGCSYQDVIETLKAGGIKVRFEKDRLSSSVKPETAAQASADLEQAQRFLDLIRPNVKSWTFQTFDDHGENKALAAISHGTLADNAIDLRMASKYGAGVFVAPNRTDGKGRKRENVRAVRAVWLDLDGAPLDPVLECKLKPHVIIETSPGRFQVIWRVKNGFPLEKFEAVQRAIASRFNGDEAVALPHGCVRLPGFYHRKAKPFRTRIIKQNEDLKAYSTEQILSEFSPVKCVTSTSKAPQSPQRKAERERAATLADKYISRDGSPPKLAPEVDAKLDEAASLHPFDYEQERKEIAKDLGVRAEALDREVEQRREDREVLPFLEDEEPWPDPVDGSELLDALTESIGRYVDMPRSAIRASALWALFTHTHDAFWISPILGITSPAPECGKTTLLACLQGLSAQALPGSNFSGPVIFRAVDQWAPTLLIDEADTFLDREELRGILNSGHDRNGAFVLRCDGENLEPRSFSTWAPKAIARIGKLAATLASRSIPIPLKRKSPDTKVQRAPRDPKAAFEELRRKCIRWGADHFIELSNAKPDLPEGLGFRAQDNWEPLLAIADLCGSVWAKRARAAAIKLSANADHVDQSQSLGVLLLQDIRDEFEQMDVEYTPKEHRPFKAVSSTMLAYWLAEREDRPWNEFGSMKKPITERGIARLLDGFQIRPKEISSGRWAGKMGYRKAQFVPAWRRYLPSEPQKNAENQQVAGDPSLGKAKTRSEDKEARKPLKNCQKRTFRG